MALQENEKRPVLEENRTLGNLEVRCHTCSDGLQQGQEKTSQFCRSLAHEVIILHISGDKTTLTTMRRPSATSAISLAAFTRTLVFKESNLTSNSGIAVIHGSPTSVSRISVAKEGGIHRSAKRFESGLSIFWCYGDQ